MTSKQEAIISGEQIKNMLLGAYKSFEKNYQYINDLNVFPVPDGDTGTNMTMTIMAAAKEVAALEDPTMEVLAKAISSGSLRGARGNSGVILSQLFRGFTKGIKKYEEIDVAILAAAFQKAVETAYKAVMKPKEGTILTVAKGAADKALELAENDISTLNWNSLENYPDRSHDYQFSYNNSDGTINIGAVSYTHLTLPTIA